MTETERTLRHNLHLLPTGRALAQVVDRFLDAYPDPDTLAQREARQILRKRTGKALDPRLVWWHEFPTASSNPRTLSGWDHSGPPSKSLRFPELMLERFDTHFQDASDELDLYGGFYHQGPHAPLYDQRNQVPLLGRDVQQDFWALDFGDRFREQVTAFWAAHRDDFSVLAKVNLLAQCNLARQSQQLAGEDVGLVGRLLGIPVGDVQHAPSLDQLRPPAPATGLRIDAYNPLPGEANAFYCLHGEGGRVVLYRPWAQTALRGFASHERMALWLHDELRRPERLARFEQGLVTDPGARDAAQACRARLQALADAGSGRAVLEQLAQWRRPIKGAFFAYLASQAEQQMRQHAERMLDNSQLRKAMWRGYLGAFLQVFGGFVPLGWPVTLVLLGATLGKLGLEVDAAVHAPTSAARRAALRAALLDTVFAALNMIDVGAGSMGLSAIAARPAYHELDADLATWQVVEQPQAALAGHEANQLLDALPTGSRELQGIRLGANGECWIDLHGLPYRVRYSSDLNVWLIVPPDNPYAFTPLRPVRLDAAGEWQLLDTPRLAGGTPPGEGGLASEPSAFWDTYMNTDETRSEALSDQALARQRALLDEQGLPELPEDDDPEADDEQFDCIDHDGRQVYSYLHDGDYRNHLIAIYTEEDSQINGFLREGKREFDFGDEAQYVEKLAESLDELPRDASVTLYRGGHGLRSTSGMHFRSGQLKVGDVLVNTDMTSFTENPYIVRQFSADPNETASSGHEGVFDDTSVVYELPAGSYEHGTPISPFSYHKNEAETLFQPGSYFQIEGIKQIAGSDYRFVHVRLREIAQPQSGVVHEMRTGQPFSKADYVTRLGNRDLAERFFPD